MGSMIIAASLPMVSLTARHRPGRANLHEPIQSSSRYRLRWTERFRQNKLRELWKLLNLPYLKTFNSVKSIDERCSTARVTRSRYTKTRRCFRRLKDVGSELQHKIEKAIKVRCSRSCAIG